MESTFFSQLGIVIIVATVFALGVRRLKLPPLVGYIMAGMILGPIGVHFLGNHEVFTVYRQIGIALLLFLAGLELDWTKAKYHFKTIGELNIGQLLLALIVGFLSSALLLSNTSFTERIWAGLFLGLGLAFSSTIIVVKLLSEGREIHSLHGRLTVGTLILQDMIAIFALTVVNGVVQPSSLSLAAILALLCVKVFALLCVMWVTSQYILPPLFARVARSGEFLFLSSVAWCFGLTIAIIWLDLPLEIGAFLAGVSLASLPYTLEMANKMRPLRDFFVILLFVSLGSEVLMPDTQQIWLITIAVAFTVFIKPIYTFITLTQRGYKSRTAFLASLGQSQLSEFALILAAIGVSHNLISPALASSISFATVLTIFISAILFTMRSPLYQKLHTVLQRFEKKGRFSVEHRTNESLEGHIIIFGYHRMGYHILKKLRALKHRVVVVDFNPDIIRRLKEQEVDCLYGDVQDDDIFEATSAKHARMVISTIPHREETIYLLQVMTKLNPDCITIVTSNYIDDALLYYKMGANYVILPHVLGGEHVADLITQYENHNLRQFMTHRAEEIKLLKARNHALYYD
jgi:Kef-type K+ transport system membrane component KefB/Trk K+ transport system NAD-binding subunit